MSRVLKDPPSLLDIRVCLSDLATELVRTELVPASISMRELVLNIIICAVAIYYIIATEWEINGSKQVSDLQGRT